MVVFFETDEEGLELQKLAFLFGWRWSSYHEGDKIKIVKEVPRKGIRFDLHDGLKMYYDSSGYYINKQDGNYLTYTGINLEIIKFLNTPRKYPSYARLLNERKEELKRLKQKKV